MKHAQTQRELDELESQRRHGNLQMKASFSISFESPKQINIQSRLRTLESHYRITFLAYFLCSIIY
jgi:hypothetical protein